MRAFYRWLAALLFAAVVVQVGLAGYGAFHAIHRADKGAITKKAIENGFDAHAVLGTVIVVLMLALLIAAAAGQLGATERNLAGVSLGLGVIQAILGGVSTSVPALGFVHTVVALVIFAVTGLLAHRAWAPASDTSTVVAAA